MIFKNPFFFVSVSVPFKNWSSTTDKSCPLWLTLAQNIWEKNTKSIEIIFPPMIFSFTMSLYGLCSEQNFSLHLTQIPTL